MKIYLSGPISGQPNLNKGIFNHYEQLLIQDGYEVVNPHDLTLPQTRLIEFLEKIGVQADKLVYVGYLVKCLIKIAQCDKICMLPGWSKSKGATLECVWAMILEKDFILVEGSEVNGGIILYKPEELEDWFEQQF